MPAVFLEPMDHLYEKVLSNIEEAKARGGRVIADSPAACKDRVDDVIIVPSTYPAFMHFVSVVPLQLLAHHVAVMKGCDVDQPGIWQRASQWSDSPDADRRRRDCQGNMAWRTLAAMCIIIAMIYDNRHVKPPPWPDLSLRRHQHTAPPSKKCLRCAR